MATITHPTERQSDERPGRERYTAEGVAPRGS